MNECTCSQCRGEIQEKNRVLQVLCSGCDNPIYVGEDALMYKNKYFHSLGCMAVGLGIDYIEIEEGDCE